MKVIECVDKNHRKFCSHILDYKIQDVLFNQYMETMTKTNMLLVIIQVICLLCGLIIKNKYSNFEGLQMIGKGLVTTTIVITLVIIIGNSIQEYIYNKNKQKLNELIKNRDLLFKDGDFTSENQLEFMKSIWNKEGAKYYERNKEDKDVKK